LDKVDFRTLGQASLQLQSFGKSAGMNFWRGQ
jgi:hypothetical protein